MTIQGSMALYGPTESVNQSASQGVSLGGDFINESRYPSLFDWSSGRLVLNGTEPQRFEVGGFDLGHTSEGFFTTQTNEVDP